MHPSYGSNSLATLKSLFHTFSNNVVLREGVKICTQSAGTLQIGSTMFAQFVLTAHFLSVPNT